nr:hypothetical protein [Bacteroidota bacterium]
MKRLILTLSCIVLALLAFCQAPQGFKYQGVIRDASGAPLENENVQIKITILDGTQAVFTEEHNTMTNDWGIVHLIFGSENASQFESINWAAGSFVAKVELNENGTWLNMGESPLISVPYALFSKNAENVDDADADPENEFQTISKTGNIITLSQNGGDVIDEIEDADADPSNELQSLSQSDLIVTMSQGGGTINVADNDDDPTNELQTINKSGNTVTLTQNGGSFIDEVNDADPDPTNEHQTIQKTGSLVTLSDGGGSFTDEVNDNDANPSNEFQTLSISGTQLSISPNGNSVPLPTNSYNPGTGIEINGNTISAKTNDPLWNANKLQGKNISTTNPSNGKILKYDGSNWTPVNDEVNDADADNDSERQRLSLSGSILSINNGGHSSGNSVDLSEIVSVTPNLAQVLAVGNYAANHDINMDIQEIVNVKRLDFANSTCYLDLGNGKIKDSNSSFGSNGEVLTCNGNGVEWDTPGGGGIGGSGTNGYVARWTSSTNLGNGKIRDNGSSVGIGMSPDSDYMLSIDGSGDDAIYAEYNSSNFAYIGANGNGGYFRGSYDGASCYSNGGSNSNGIYALGSSGAKAGKFYGNVQITGSLSKGSGSFLIDHPDDPLNKTLRHNFVESPENLCLYRGVVELDYNGEGVVILPDYFSGLTKENEASVVLTSIGIPFLTGYSWNEDFNEVNIYGVPNRKVSYLVLSDRDDPVIHQLSRPIVMEKGENGETLQGKLLYPEAYGYPKEYDTDYERLQKIELIEK